MRTIYAVLDTVNKYEAGYIKGVMAQLKKKQNKQKLNKV